MRVGIDDLNLYASTLSIDCAEIASARNFSAKDLTQTGFKRRSVPPPYEDPITLAVNAARPLVEEAGRDAFDLLIIATETGVDYGKPLSSYVHKYLELSPSCRNFEIKHACYGGTAGLQMAVSRLRSGDTSKRALVITTDIARRHMGGPIEITGGAGAIAMSLASEPRLLVLEQPSGFAAREVYDTCRPTATSEWSDGLLSLSSYLDLFEMAMNHYGSAVGPIRFLDHFSSMAYHTPLESLIRQAHALAVQADLDDATRQQVEASFERMVRPSLVYNQEIGNIYSGSLYSAILGLLDQPSISAGMRVGLFSYGSGACAEFFSGRVAEAAPELAGRRQTDQHLSKRRKLSFREYEAARETGERGWMSESFEPDLDFLPDHYRGAYQDRGLLVLDRVELYYRTYRWS